MLLSSCDHLALNWTGSKRHVGTIELFLSKNRAVFVLVLNCLFNVFNEIIIKLVLLTGREDQVNFIEKFSFFAIVQIMFVAE